MTLATVIYLVIALCLIGTVIWAFQNYVQIPGPFGWVKGIITFIFILIACYFLWDNFVVGHIATTHPLR